MELSKLDKNFEIKTAIDEPDVKWYSVLEEPFDIYGLYKPKEDGLFRRMPAEVAENIHSSTTGEKNVGIANLYKNTSGGRIRFKTDSRYLMLKVEYDWLHLSSHMPEAGVAGFDIHRVEDGKYIYMGIMMPNMDDDKGYVRKRNIMGRMTEYLIGMPLYNNVTNVYIGISENAKLEHGSEYKIKKPIVYYGSSITQGACASRPMNAYQGYISEYFDADYINLGFSGNAKGEQDMFDYIASLEMSAFVYDYDWNSSYDEVCLRHIEGYKTIRAAHPDIPIVMAGFPAYNVGETGGGRGENIRKTYEYALSLGDTNVAMVTTEDICDGDFKHHCTVDNCHPNDLGFYRMAKSFIEKLEPMLNKKEK